MPTQKKKKKNSGFQSFPLYVFNSNRINKSINYNEHKLPNDGLSIRQVSLNKLISLDWFRNYILH